MSDEAFFDKDNLPAEDKFRPARKTAVTRFFGPLDPPVKVQTREGEYLASDEPCYLALDEDGFPYPVAASVFDKSYEWLGDNVEQLPDEVEVQTDTTAEGGNVYVVNVFLPNED